MQKLLKSLKWIDNNILKIFLVGFIFLIPLYPKFPLFDLEYTYISIRFEDIYIAVFALFFLIQLLRKKVTLNTRFLPLFIAFWGAVFLSFIWGAYVANTIPVDSIGFLHSLRRVEYMMFFFIAASLITSKNDLFFYMRFVVIVLTLVAAYGVAQKYIANVPAVQTMNPEFAKGYLLYLTPEARISSTFAGHYDLAAYLVFLLPITLGLFIIRKHLVYYFTVIVSIFALALTASRVSYIAYLASTFPFLVWSRRWIILIITALITAGLSYTSQNLTSRFFDTFQVKQIFVNEQTGQVVVPQQTTIKDLPAGSFYVDLKDKVSTPTADTEKNKALAKEQIRQYIRQEASKSGKILSSSEEAALVEEQSLGLIAKNTIVSDISLAVRFQVSWPRALESFKSNPVLGTGPYSITEATDGDYHRWLGEFGFLGTALFLSIIATIGIYILRNISRIEKKYRILFWGFLFGTAGLMINATLIDVFEASKMAYTFWLVAGIFTASVPYFSDKVDTKKREK